MRAQAFIYAIVALIAIAYLVAPATALLRLSHQSGSNDEERLINGLRALMASSGNEVLDLENRVISLSGPARVPRSEATSSHTRTIRNGRLHASGNNFRVTSITRSCRLDSRKTASTTWSQLTCSQSIPTSYVGARVTGHGVGREVYAFYLYNGAKNVQLSSNTFGESSTLRTYTFTRYQYLLDFSRTTANNLRLENIAFTCANKASGLMLPTRGSNIRLTSIFINGVANRGVTSSGNSCKNLRADGLMLHNGDDAQRQPDKRANIGININTQGAILNNVFAEKYLHCVVATEGFTLRGSHVMQGGSGDAKTYKSFNVLIRSPTPAGGVKINGNYIDNAGILWSSEAAGVGFRGAFTGAAIEANGWLLITSRGNPMRFIELAPFHRNLGVHNVQVVGNMLRSQDKSGAPKYQSPLTRMDNVDASKGTLAVNNFRDIRFDANDMYAITQQTCNPCDLEFSSGSRTKTWTTNMGNWRFPFNGVPIEAHGVGLHSVQSSSGNYFNLPSSFGGNNGQVSLAWSTAVKGSASATIRCDHPATGSMMAAIPVEEAELVRAVTPEGAAVSPDDPSYVDPSDSDSSVWGAVAVAAATVLGVVVAAIGVGLLVTALVAVVLAMVARRTVSSVASATSSTGAGRDRGTYEAVEVPDAEDDLSLDADSETDL